jgi:Fe-S-cluster-containing hydrogenase component 2
MDIAMQECGGCLTCEMACSYKQTGEFNHHISGIEILKNKEGKGYIVRLIEDSSEGRISCDACVDLEGGPMCMRYCHKREDLKVIIDQFITTAVIMKK